MAGLIHLVYASRGEFKSFGGRGIEPEVARILAQSRKNNARQDIGGVLYYGNGFFFQCLEGERDKVKELYEGICKDPRHGHARLLAQYPVEKRSFSSWSMKYVSVDREVQALLKRHGQAQFDPYQFSEQLVKDLVLLLAATKDSPNEAEAVPAPRSRGAFDASPAAAETGQARATLALVTSGMSLLVAIAALVVALQDR